MHSNVLAHRLSHFWQLLKFNKLYILGFISTHLLFLLFLTFALLNQKLSDSCIQPQKRFRPIAPLLVRLFQPLLPLSLELFIHNFEPLNLATQSFFTALPLHLFLLIKNSHFDLVADLYSRKDSVVLIGVFKDFLHLFVLLALVLYAAQHSWRGLDWM